MKSLFHLVFVAILTVLPTVASAQSCGCHLCRLMRAVAARSDGAQAAAANAAIVSEERTFATRFVPPTASASSTGSGSGTGGGGTQVVYLDFDSGVPATSPDAYTAFERQQILGLVREDYELFDFEFTLAQPTAGDYSTITMNDGPAFGIAEQIDFRNIDRNDNATVNVPHFAAPTDQSRILLTATVISHELGHILGLRHADAFGPIGAGINPDNFASDGFEFPGPSDATESGFHIMQTDSDNGEPFETFFGEREAVKLAFNESGTVIDESSSPKGSTATAQPITLASLTVPNTLRVGEFATDDFEIEALTIIGSVGTDGGGPNDFYSFQANAGDVLYVEGISGILDPDVAGFGSERLSDSIASRVQVFDADGSILDYFGSDAVSPLGPEDIDAVIFDLLIPQTGTYFVSIDGDGISQVPIDIDGDGEADDIDDDGVPDFLSTADETPTEGDYELFLYTFGVDSGTQALTAGDFNGDGVVNAIDYTIMRDSLADEVAVGSGADGNANGIVDPEDFRYWLGNYGRVSPPSAVPEPAAAALLVLGSLGVAARRVV